MRCRIFHNAAIEAALILGTDVGLELAVPLSEHAGHFARLHARCASVYHATGIPAINSRSAGLRHGRIHVSCNV